MEAHVRNQLVFIAFCISSFFMLIFYIVVDQSLEEERNFAAASESKRLDGDMFDSDVAEGKRPKCLPVSHIAFLPMDTTTDASSTRSFQRLFAQYGMKNNLSYALPTGNNEWRNGLGHSFNPLVGNMSTVIGLTENSEDFHFDIIFHEMIFDAVKIYEIMPGDTIFISLLTDPVMKFYDAWVKYEDHWLMKESFKGLSRLEAMSVFLNDTDEYLKEPRKLYLEAQMLKGKGIRKANSKMKHGIEPLIHLVNPQLFVLGFESTEFRQVDNLYQAMIKSTESQFHLMLLDEYFEDSLAVLKHKLCWTVRDVVYLAAAIKRPQHSRRYEDFGLTDELVDKIRNLNKGDVQLYDTFQEVFWNTLETIGRARVNVIKHQIFSNADKIVQRCIKNWEMQEGNAVPVFLEEMREDHHCQRVALIRYKFLRDLQSRQRKLMQRS